MNTKVWYLLYFAGVYHTQMIVTFSNAKMHVWYVWFILCPGPLKPIESKFGMKYTIIFESFRLQRTLTFLFVYSMIIHHIDDSMNLIPLYSFLSQLVIF